MGGNAIRGAVRMSPKMYAALIAHVGAVLTALGLRHSFPPKLGDKPDFGDLDVLVVADASQRLAVAAALEPVQTARNGNVLSLGLVFQGELVQVDFIFLADELMENATVFYSYAIFGMCLGSTVKRFGMIYGHTGLRLRVHESTIDLSHCPREIFAFLGLDDKRFRRGFVDVIELLDFMHTSPYVHLEKFLRAHEDDRKECAEACAAGYKCRPDGGAVPPDPLDFFNKKDAWEARMAAIEQQNRLREKFNGHQVAAWTGLSGPELGAFMGRFRKTVSDEKLLSMTTEEVRARVMSIV